MDMRSIFGLLILSGFALSDELLPLPEAVSAAVEHNFDLAASRLRAAVPGLQTEIERAAFRWKVRPFFGVESSEDEVALTRAGVRLDRQLQEGTLLQTRGEWVSRDEGENEQTVDVSVEQPLFRRYGSLWAKRGVDSAVYQSRVAEWGLHRETESLMLRVVEAYTETLRQQRRVVAESEALVRADELVRLLEIRERQGRATGVDLLEMRMLHQEAQLRYRRAEEGERRVRGELAELLGRAPEQLPALQAVTPPDTPEKSELELYELARERRTEIHQALATYEDALRQVDLQRRELYPDVRLLGRWQPVSENDQESWFAGLSGGQTLDLGVTRLQIQREETQARAALTTVAATELRISREIRNARSRLSAAVEEEGLAEGQLRLAWERLRLARRLFPLGRGDAPQLRQAEESATRAEHAREDARVERVRAAYAFLHSLGLLLGAAAETPTR